MMMEEPQAEPENPSKLRALIQQIREQDYIKREF